MSYKPVLTTELGATIEKSAPTVFAVEAVVKAAGTGWVIHKVRKMSQEGNQP